MDPLSDEVSDPRLKVARLEGQVEVLASQLAQLQATDEHHRAELERCGRNRPKPEQRNGNGKDASRRVGG